MLRNFIFAAILFLFAFSPHMIFAQKHKTNLDLFFLLIDETRETLENKGEKLTLTAENPGYEVLANFANNKKTENKINRTVRFSIDTAFTNYREIFREGLWGEYYLVREINLSLKTEQDKKITLLKTDTVAAIAYPEIETSSLPFTRDELPAEPFLESVVEPVVFIVTSAAIIFALFFGRS